MRKIAAVVSLLTLTAAAAAQHRYLDYQVTTDRERALRTPPPYAYNQARSWHGVESIRRPWTGRVWLGGEFGPYAFPWGTPGPDAYGADDLDFRLVHARVGNTAVSFSPWVEIPGNGHLARMEAARKQWLREHGYTIHPRIFRNPRPVNFENEEQSSVNPLERGNWHKILVPKSTRPSFEVRNTDDTRFVSEPNAAQPRVFVSSPVAPASPLARLD